MDKIIPGSEDPSTNEIIYLCCEGGGEVSTVNYHNIMEVLLD